MKLKYLALIALLTAAAACSTARKHTKTDSSQTIASETTQTILTTDSINLSKFLTAVYDNPRIEVTRFAAGETIKMTLQAAKATFADKTDVRAVSLTSDSMATQSSTTKTISEERKTSPSARFPILFVGLLSALLIALSWRGIRSRR